VDENQPHLPEEPNSFIGREQELGELRRVLHVTRALTLCGPGGIGKTRLALRVLAEAAAEFPGGTWFVELADLRHPDQVLPRVAAVIGVAEERGRPLLQTLAEALRPRRMLLALDNCEHLIDACAQLARHLLVSSPGLRLLLTSREPLRVAAETIWQVPPLSVSPADTAPVVRDATRYEAIRLFADRAAASRPGFTVGSENIAAITAICRALDGIPLAIELAAARVRALSVEQIQGRLDDRFRLLADGDRSAAPRQRTLSAAIEWSHELLSPPERTLFRRLSVFTGWSLEMAEQVCSDEQLPARDVLCLTAALVDKSLIVLEPEVLGQARYRMLDTIREYAAARLAQAGEATAFRLRLRDYTLRTAEHNMALGMARIPAPWSARVDVFRRYDVDASNVFGVLSWCLARNDPEAGLRICVAVSPCWIVWGSFAEGCEWLEKFLALDTSDVPAGVRGAALVVRAQLTMSSDPAAAESLATEGQKLCRDDGEQFWTTVAQNLLSEIALHTGRAEEAAARADEALAIAQAAGDGWNEGYALGTRAAIAARLGRLREAQQLANASVSVMRDIDQQWGAARGLLGLGDLARLRGHPGEAHGRYVEALAVLREVGARPEIARCLAGLGRVAMDLGAIEQARRHLTRSLRLSHVTGARIGVARGLEAFAALATHENRPELAVQLTAAATALREAAGLPPLPGARTESYLAPARRLGEAAVARLWAQGLAMSSEAAVALALDMPVLTASPGENPALTVVGGYQVAAAPPSSLTPREHQIAALVAEGRSNKAIAEELSISPTTAARHVANILAKLGFTSRTQIAAWFADHRSDAAPGGRAEAVPDKKRSLDARHGCIRWRSAALRAREGVLTPIGARERRCVTVGMTNSCSRQCASRCEPARPSRRGSSRRAGTPMPGTTSTPSWRSSPAIPATARNRPVIPGEAAASPAPGP
jgi:predicted ATPase/DNA-binding CsgD family transcriptional regulator/tetratricopeptide (TPR) repeat protein